MNQIEPSKGRIVLYREPGFVSNGDNEHVAIITRVWTRDCVNLTVLPDCGAPVSKTSVVFHDKDDGDYGWRWPDRT